MNSPENCGELKRRWVMDRKAFYSSEAQLKMDDDDRMLERVRFFSNYLAGFQAKYVITLSHTNVESSVIFGSRNIRYK